MFYSTQCIKGYQMKFEVHYKEKLYFALLSTITLLGYTVGFLLFLAFFDKALFVLLYVIAFLQFKFIASRLLLGYLKGNAIKVTKSQFPDIFELLTSHSKNLGLAKVPEMYVLQGNGILNAFATKIARRNFVVLYSDVLELAYQEGMDAVSFIIGHELGHIKRNHVGFAKSLLTWPAKLIPFLGSAYSRACEYTCDNIGFALCPAGATKGILVLAAGKQLYKKVDVSALIATGTAEYSWTVFFAELFSSHPTLIKRVTNINQRNHEIDLASQMFVSPKVENSQKELQ